MTKNYAPVVTISLAMCGTLHEQAMALAVYKAKT
jgi:hypothetical protein